MVDSSWPPPPKENPSNRCPKNAGQIKTMNHVLMCVRSDRVDRDRYRLAIGGGIGHRLSGFDTVDGDA